jgi:leucine efflux protein
MSFYGVTDLWTYVIGAFGIILLPGPNSLFILSVATARGIRPGFQGALGVFVGDAVLLALVGLGAAGLLRTTPVLFMIVKYAGAAYLSWIGLQLIRAAAQKWRNAEAHSAERNLAPEVPAHLEHPFKRALTVSLLNPKAILFLLSFFVQFIDPTYDTPIVPFLILSAIVMGFSAFYLSALIIVGAQLAQGFRARQKLSASLSSAVGAVFVWFGLKLANASLA